MNESLQYYGISHRVANIEIREKFSLGKEEISQFYYNLHEQKSIKELFILSTCNRTEFYLYGSEDNEIKKWIISQYELLNRSVIKNLSKLLEKTGDDVISHLFNVASGINSMILGETQITAQIKDSFNHAHHSGSLGPVLTRLINSSLECSKSVRTKTNLSAGVLSVSSAAVDHIMKSVKNLQSKSILLIGAGSTGRLTALNLKKRGILNIFISNRNRKNSQRLADDIGGTVIPFKEKDKFLRKTDVLITCTAADKPVFLKKDFSLVKQPLFTIDLSVPRNIQPEVSELENVELFTIDGLDDIVKENIEIRKKELPQAKIIISEMEQVFKTWLRTLSVTPTIRELKSYYHDIKKSTIDQIQTKYSEETVQFLDTLSDRLIKRMLKTQIESLKQQGESEDSSTEFVESVRLLYKLDHKQNGKN